MQNLSKISEKLRSWLFWSSTWSCALLTRGSSFHRFINNMPGLDPFMNVLGATRLSSNFLKQRYVIERLKWYWGSSVVVAGILLNNMKSPLSLILSVILYHVHIQCQLQSVGHNTYSCHCYWIWHRCKIRSIYRLWEVSIGHLRGYGMQIGETEYSDT